MTIMHGKMFINILNAHNPFSSIPVRFKPPQNSHGNPLISLLIELQILPQTYLIQTQKALPRNQSIKKYLQYKQPFYPRMILTEVIN